MYDGSGARVHVEKIGRASQTAQPLDYLKAGGMPIARVDLGVGVYYEHSDPLGSPVTVTNNWGSIQSRERYTPFGMARDKPSFLDDHGGFTGHLKDSATGLTYMQARYYDPAMGRFLSVDPVTFMDTGDPRYFNRYAYAGNDPINHLDPDGQAIGKAIKFVRNTIKHKGNPIKGATETLSGIGDDLGTLTDGQLNLDDAAAVVSLITGFGKKDQKAIEGAAKKLNNRRGRDFTKAQKRDFEKNNADANGGNMTCEDCGRNDLQNIGNKKGQPTPPNQAQVHHDPAIKNGGGRDSDGKVLCPECHQQRHRDEK